MSYIRYMILLWQIYDNYFARFELTAVNNDNTENDIVNAGSAKVNENIEIVNAFN